MKKTTKYDFRKTGVEQYFSEFDNDFFDALFHLASPASNQLIKYEIEHALSHLSCDIDRLDKFHSAKHLAHTNTTDKLII